MINSPDDENSVLHSVSTNQLNSNSNFRRPVKRSVEHTFTPVTEKKAKVASTKKVKINFAVAHSLVYRKKGKLYHEDAKNASAGDYYGNVDDIYDSKDSLKSLREAACEVVKNKQLSLFFHPASACHKYSQNF